MSIETIEHAGSGAEFVICEHGANIMSFKPVINEAKEKNEREILFVSKESKGFPMKGGIPIEFPIVTPFGDKDDMPEGGFLQQNIWTNDREYMYDAKSDAAVQFSLPFDHVTTARGHGLWAAAEPGMVAYQAETVYNVKVRGPQLSAALSISNPSGSRANTYPFQILFHNYFKVAGQGAMNPKKCYVRGLEGYVRQDKTTHSSVMEEQSADPVVLKPEEETHYIFDPKGHMKNDLDVIIGIGDHREVQLTASAKIDETPVAISCVVWNPHKAKARKMEGFGLSEWQDMICVMPGIMERQMLQAQQTLVFEYSIKLLAKEGPRKDRAVWRRESVTKLEGSAAALNLEE